MSIAFRQKARDTSARPALLLKRFYSSYHDLIQCLIQI